MSPSSSRNMLGQTKRESAESKAETTKRISLEIQQTEIEQRQAKTEKLRLARLAQQADAKSVAAAAPKKSKPKKVSRAKT